jgi:hypothetical protein
VELFLPCSASAGPEHGADSLWGDAVARKDLGKLQPMHKALQQLWQEGLIGVHLLWMFVSRQIQPL